MAIEFHEERHQFVLSHETHFSRGMALRDAVGMPEVSCSLV